MNCVWIYVPELSEKASKVFNQIQAALPKLREEASAERITKLPNIGYKGKNPKLRLSALLKIGARYARNGDLHVMPHLLLGIVSLLRSVI